jgi:hypothetical protein
MGRRIAASLIALAVSTQALAKIPLFVLGDTSGNLGDQLVFAIKDALGGSQSYTVAPSADAAGLNVYVTAIAIPNTGLFAYSLVYVVGDHYVESSAGWCSEKSIPNCVPAILGAIDRSVAHAQAWVIRVRSPSPKK